MNADTHAFIVRIWFEATDETGQAMAWRGSIDHVGCQQRLYFHDLEGIIRYIEEQTGVRHHGHMPWWRVIGEKVRNAARRTSHLD